MARAAPDGAAFWLDQSWFSRWPYRFRAWAAKDARLRVAQRWSEKVDTTALYAALDDESQEAFLRWAAGQPDSEETVQFLEALMAHYFRKDHLPSDDDATAVYGKEPDELPEPRQSA